MSEGMLVHVLRESLMLVLTLSLPVLLVATLVGLTVGLVQAVTQIQDQTLPATVKIIAVIAVLALAGPMLARPLVQQAERLFDQFPAMTR